MAHGKKSLKLLLAQNFYPFSPSGKLEHHDTDNRGKVINR
jgi:hypothetical protein